MFRVGRAGMDTGSQDTHGMYAAFGEACLQGVEFLQESPIAQNPVGHCGGRNTLGPNGRIPCLLFGRFGMVDEEVADGCAATIGQLDVACLALLRIQDRTVKVVHGGDFVLDRAGKGGRGGQGIAEDIPQNTGNRIFAGTRISGNKPYMLGYVHSMC